jgi:hypothetical protein
MMAPRSPAIRMEGWDPSYPKRHAKETLRARVTEPWGHDDATDGGSVISIQIIIRIIRTI